MRRIASLFILFSIASLACARIEAFDASEGQGGLSGEGGEGGEINHGGASSQPDKCCELGAICHVVGDDVPAEVRACHDLGHSNVKSDCDREYARCQIVCAGANDDPVEHGCE